MFSADISTLLQFVNPDTGDVRCSGYAPSQGRRCRNPIAQRNASVGYDQASQLQLLVKDSTKLHTALVDIAERMLCVRYHRDQAHIVANRWEKIIRTDLLNTSAAAQLNREAEAKAIQEQEIINRMLWEKKKLMQQQQQRQQQEQQQQQQQQLLRERLLAAELAELAKKDDMPATLKLEDSGYISDDASDLSGDQDEDGGSDVHSLESCDSEAASTHSNSVDNEDTTAAHQSILAAAETQTVVEQMSAACSGATNARPTMKSVVQTPEMKHKSTQTEDLILDNHLQASVEPTEHERSITSWHDKLSDNCRSVLFWFSMAFILDMLLSI